MLIRYFRALKTSRAPSQIHFSSLRTPRSKTQLIEVKSPPPQVSQSQTLSRLSNFKPVIQLIAREKHHRPNLRCHQTTTSQCRMI